MSHNKTQISRVQAKEAAKALMVSEPGLTYTQALNKIAKQHGYAHVQHMSASRRAMPERAEDRLVFDPLIPITNDVSSAADLITSITRARHQVKPIFIRRTPGTALIYTLQEVSKSENYRYVGIQSSVIDAAHLLDLSGMLNEVTRAIEHASLSQSTILFVVDEFDSAISSIRDVFLAMQLQRKVGSINFPDNLVMIFVLGEKRDAALPADAIELRWRPENYLVTRISGAIDDVMKESGRPKSLVFAGAPGTGYGSAIRTVASAKDFELVYAKPVDFVGNNIEGLTRTWIDLTKNGDKTVLLVLEGYDTAPSSAAKAMIDLIQHGKAGDILLPPSILIIVTGVSPIEQYDRQRLGIDSAWFRKNLTPPSK